MSFLMQLYVGYFDALSPNLYLQIFTIFIMPIYM